MPVTSLCTWSARLPTGPPVTARQADSDAGRFLTVPQVAEELATSEVQFIAMLRRGDLRGFELRGRGQWRIERAELEAYIQRCYEETKRELEGRSLESHGRNRT